ncbi:MAG: GNAT family N-acetyltransferase [Kordiimonadaceae bacterium]|nr:GNAT family N-acetyltransferase [Kordiimonadaceae bacterium]
MSKSKDANETEWTLRPARADEAEALSALCLRSKAFWNYTDEQIESFRTELTLSAKDIETQPVIVVELAGVYLGIARIIPEGDTAVLEDLFIDPSTIGTGLGRQLFNWVVKAARDTGAATLSIDADPNAEPFYKHMGAVTIGRSPSGSIPGRLLPQMEYDLRH